MPVRPIKTKTRLIAVFLSAVILGGGAQSACIKAPQLSIPKTSESYASQKQSVRPELISGLYTGEAVPLREDHRKVILTLLSQDLWTPRDMYDACHYLMVPMHYAFRCGDDEIVRAFSDFFGRFSGDISDNDEYGFCQQPFLHRMQFLYLCTNFMNLCSANGFEDLIPAGLSRQAQSCAETYLFCTEGNWHVEKTVLKRLRGILSGKIYDRRYYGAIEDLDSFCLAILCDLNALAKLRGEKPPQSAVLAAQLAEQIYSDPLLNIETEGGGWLLQPGVWSDHGDYAYAGNAKIYEGIKPRPREDVPWDTSHFTRWALFLRSYQSAQDDMEKWDLFTLRIEQMANQMALYVMKNVDGNWLMTTFMDGTNGVYRYSYHEDGVGLQGYGLSGTFLLGWYAFLDDPRITACYRDILEHFPMSGDRSNPYFDCITVREQNPYFDMETAFDMGTYECIIACSAGLFK